MSQKLTVVLVSLFVCGALMGIGTTVEAGKGTFGNSRLEDIQQDLLNGIPQLHRVALDRTPTPTLPESPTLPECRGDVDGTVSLLTLFFNDGKNSNEPDTVVSMFPCGTAQDDERSLPGFVFPQKDNDKSGGKPCDSPSSDCESAPGRLSSDSLFTPRAAEDRGLD